jgi:ketosteroid isomerase-like protein
MVSPRFLIRHSPGLPWGGTFEGQNGTKVFLERMAESVTAHLSIEGILDSGDHIAVMGRTYGATRRARRRFDVPFVHLWEFEDGVAVRLDIVIDLPKFHGALADAA